MSIREENVKREDSDIADFMALAQSFRFRRFALSFSFSGKGHRVLGARET